MSDPTQAGASSITLEDIESSQNEPKPVDLTTKLDGDEVPEELRGKTMAEVIALQSGMKEALLTSEDARKNAETMAATAAAAASQPPAPAPTAPEPEPMLTDEEIAEIHQEDPIRAIKLMNEQAIRLAEKNLESRLAPMFAGTAASVEQAARVRYKEDFEVIGPEIEQFIQTLPNKQVLANPQGWDDLIALVRGKNLDKIIQAKASAVSSNAQAQAQAEQQDLTGFTTVSNPTKVQTLPHSADKLDAVQLDICSKLGMSPEDYITWSKVTK